MIRNHWSGEPTARRYSVTEALSQEIGKDERLPSGVDEIERYHLPIFAEWHRRLDEEFGRDQ